MAARAQEGRGRAPVLIGREDVLAAAVHALTAEPSLVLLEGEAGIGKTSLLRACLDAPAMAGRTVMVAACPPLSEPFPLGPLVDGVRRLRPRLADLGLTPLSGALRPLFPEWSAELPSEPEPLDDPTTTRHRLFSAITDLVDRLGVSVLVVEDAHWADAATIDWLLTRCASGHGLSVVVTYRPLEVAPDSPLRRLTSRTPIGMRMLRLPLEPLTPQQTRQLVAAMFDTDQVSERFATFLHEHTDGLPLAIEETVLLLRDRHDVVRRGGVWARRVLEELHVPPTVRDSVLERIGRLDGDTRAVLAAAAVLAAPAGDALLTEVAGLDEHAGRAGVAAALGTGLLQQTGTDRFVFRHALDAKAVGESIPASESRRLHSRAADCLQRLDPQPVVRLARHFREAGDLRQWCRYAEATADLALDSGDDRTAVTVLLDLLTTADPPAADLGRLAIKLGETAVFGAATLGDLPLRVIGLLRRILAGGDLSRPHCGEIRLLLGRLLREQSEEQAAYAEIEAAIPDLEHDPGIAARAMLILAKPLVADWPAERHLCWLQRAAELLPAITSSKDRLRCASNRATALLLLGEESGWTLAEDVPGKVSGSAETRILAKGLLNTAQVATVWGRYSEAHRRLDAADEAMAISSVERRLTSASVARAYLDWCTGNWAGLRDTLADVLASDDAVPLDRLQARQLVALLDLVSGARAAAEQGLLDVSREYARLGAVEPDAVTGPAALGRIKLADAAPELALRHTTPAVRMIAAKGVWLWATDLAPVHVEASIRSGRPDDALALVERLAGWLNGRTVPAAHAALTLCRGIVASDVHGDRVAAADVFAEAAKAWADLPRPYDEQLALERLGRCLLEDGDESRGLTALSDAQAGLRRLGATWDADRVAQLLRRHGVDVARTWRRGPRGYGDHLSPRELEVVELVARGMTNRQIGEALFLSPKTVDRHLRTSMRKLKVSSRTALAMAAADAGLLRAKG